MIRMYEYRSTAICLSAPLHKPIYELHWVFRRLAFCAVGMGWFHSRKCQVYLLYNLNIILMVSCTAFVLTFPVLPFG